MFQKIAYLKVCDIQIHMKWYKNYQVWGTKYICSMCASSDIPHACSQYLLVSVLELFYWIARFRHPNHTDFDSLQAMASELKLRSKLFHSQFAAGMWNIEYFDTMEFQPVRIQTVESLKKIIFLFFNIKSSYKITNLTYLNKLQKII